MQTKQQIETLLASAGVRPNKRLGQHFLIDLNLMRLFVNRTGITKDDVVLEVGPGTGSMTEALTDLKGFVIAVEYDKTLAKIVKHKLKNKENLEVINSDILKNQNALNEQVVETISEKQKLFNGRLLLVSNLPYDVSSALMINLIIGPTIADAMFVTVQKEVALRMTAGVDDKLYGTLGIFMAAAGQAQVFHNLGKNVFWPHPKVDSAMVEFFRNEEKIKNISDMQIFKSVVSLFMQHRRKTLRACAKFATSPLDKIDNWLDIFETCNIDPAKRPENIAPVDFVNIANQCSVKL